MLNLAKLVLHLICSYCIEDNQETLGNFLGWMTPGNDDTSMGFSGRQIRQMERPEIGTIVGKQRPVLSGRKR